MNKIILIILLIFRCVISLFVGIASISIYDLLNLDSEKLTLIYLSRIPRVVVLVLAGMGLSISGLIMQQMTQIKFVSPTIAGTLAATLGVLVSILIIPTEAH